MHWLLLFNPVQIQSRIKRNSVNRTKDICKTASSMNRGYYKPAVLVDKYRLINAEYQ